MPQEISVINKISKKVSELTVDDIATYCEQHGVTVSALCLKLSQLLNATRDIKDRDGEVLETVADNNIQLKALGVGLELLKLTGIKTEGVIGVIQHQMAPGDIDRIAEISRELKSLDSRLALDKVQQGLSSSEKQGVIIDTVITV